MSRHCTNTAAFDDWERAGSRAALPTELERHAQACAVCGARLADVRRVRELFAPACGPTLPPQRLQEMRFLLMAQARQRRSRVRRGPSGGAWVIAARWLAAAACALLVVLLLLERLPPRPPPLLARRELAEIHLLPGAEGRPLSSGPEEAYSLFDGNAEFVVQSLREGERFRVLVGSSVLEVRGTRFRVGAERGWLVAVAVTEGAVLVTHGGKSELIVAGAQWSSANAPPVDAAPATDAPLAPALPRTDTALPAQTAAPRALAVPARNGGKLAARAEAGTHLPGAALGSSAAERFGQARALLTVGHAEQAARAFAELVADGTLDPELRADALYWSARSRRQSGDLRGAQARAEQYLEATPDGWYAAQAALLVGEVLLDLQQQSQAGPWLRRASERGSAPVRARAEQLLREAQRSRAAHGGAP